MCGRADPIRVGENGAVEPETASRGTGPVDESVRELPGARCGC